MIEGIVAYDLNKCIGKQGGLPWHIKEDMRLFKRLTLGHIVVMGSKTANSIGRPLGGRLNVVISSKFQSDTSYQAPDSHMDGYPTITYYENNFYNGIVRAILLQPGKPYAYPECPEKRIFIAGGGSIYNQAIDNGLVDIWHISLIHDIVLGGDTFFPAIKGRYSVTDKKEHDKFTYFKLERDK